MPTVFSRPVQPSASAPAASRLPRQRTKSAKAAASDAAAPRPRHKPAKKAVAPVLPTVRFLPFIRLCSIGDLLLSTLCRLPLLLRRQGAVVDALWCLSLRPLPRLCSPKLRRTSTILIKMKIISPRCFPFLITSLPCQLICFLAGGH